jgi:hypothetical protein
MKRSAELGITTSGIFINDDHPSQLQFGGLNEISQDNYYRGYVPEINQPNHTANCWKSEYSHPYTDDSGRSHTSFTSDYVTPLRRHITSLDVMGTSAAHQMARFGGI